MSLTNAKAYKSGILINEKNKKSLIVPFQISLSENYNPNYKFLESINRQLYHLFFPSVKRFTIFFDRNDSNIPSIFFYVYFSAPTLRGLHKVAKLSMQRLKNYLNNIGLIVDIINSEEIFQDILAKIKPQSITDVKPHIHKVITQKETTYLAVASLYFTPEQEKSDLTVFLRDFYAILKVGRVNLDLNYNPSAKESNKKNMAGITITIEGLKLIDVVLEQRKLQTLLSIFSNQKEDDEVQNYWFAEKHEIMGNFGKIILGQGWKTFPVEETFLNFAAYFNLLLDIN